MLHMILASAKALSTCNSYGQRGFEEIIGILGAEMVDTHIISTRRTAPLDVDSYLRRVLVPEVAIRFIQDDRSGCSRSQAIEILAASRAYGLAVFPSNGGANMRETKAERLEREKEEEEEEKRRAEILSSKCAGAEALKKGQRAILAIQQLGK